MLPTSDFSWWSSRKSGCCLHGRCCWQLLLTATGSSSAFLHLSLRAAAVTFLEKQLKGTGATVVVKRVNGSVWGTRGAGSVGFGFVHLPRKVAGTWVWLADLLWCSGTELRAPANCKARQKSTATYHLYGLPRVSAARACISAFQHAE